MNHKFLFCSLVVVSLPVLATHERAEGGPVSPLYEPQNHAAERLNHSEANRIRANAARNKTMMDENRRAIEERNREIEAVRRYNRELGKGK